MQRRIDEYRWRDMRKELQDLREETHLLRARFADVYGFNRATVTKVEKVDKHQDYTPSEEVIKRWLAATSREPLHEFMARFEIPEGAPAPAEPLILEHAKKTAKAVGNLPDNSLEAVHTLPLPQLVGDTSDATDRPGSALSAEDHAAVLEQFATSLWVAAAALRARGQIQSNAADESDKRPGDDAMGGSGHGGPGRVK